MASDRPQESFAALFEQSTRAAARPKRPRVGDEVEAVVVQVGKAAVFVELSGHEQAFFDALDLRNPDGTSTVKEGDKLRARIAQVDDEGVRVELAESVRVASDGGGAEEAVKIVVGQMVSGAVDRVENYGLFLQIDGTKGRAGRGLLPTVELGTPRGADLRKAFPIGTKLQAKVIAVEEGKMRLSLRAVKDDEERKQFDGFREKDKASEESRGFGTMADLLKNRPAPKSPAAAPGARSPSPSDKRKGR
jgi:small subunit ribosomal protein S1